GPACGSSPPWTAAPARSPPTASSWPSATSPTPACSKASWPWTTATSPSARAWAATSPPPRWKACLPPATWPTSTTARRSPRPASAAWPRWTPSASWTRAPEATDEGRTLLSRWRPGRRAPPRSRDGASMSAGLRTRWLDGLARVPARQWDALHDGGNPFVAHAFLEGLERHGCLRPGWGWTPRHLTLWDGDTLVAAAPGYLKTNSHGEFVFDHAWARAYAGHGLDYYPKWLCAVPYSPVTGPRLLARDPAVRGALVRAMCALVEDEGLSSAHVNFHLPAESGAFDAAWLERTDVQYHWRNPGHWRRFDDYLADMDHRHRKNIRQERGKVASSGITFRRLHGDEAGPDEL